MKRLYVGGLGHTVSEKDLKDRFGKFGDVSDVEIVTRKNEDGAPLKTFGYININITDAEYKRCLGTLNKSTWKGGTLLIELAKESFLHRLAEERQQIAKQSKDPKVSPQKMVVESLKAAGVEDFHMKAAVPGTEIPGHKNWVVSKFGRVLPVLYLNREGKRKIFKYDPSKHCHNIKRLETADDVTTVSKLTWEIPGGDDEISKKRRGEFPEQKSHAKKSKVDISSLLSRFTQNNGITTASQQKRLGAKGNTSVCVFDSDGDSEEEIRMFVAQEHLRTHKQTITKADDDNNLEVVGDDFVVRSNIMWANAEQDPVQSLVAAKDDEEYDSADTDEILTQRKTLCAEKSAQSSQDSQIKSTKKQEKVDGKPVSASSESDSSSDEASDDDDGDDSSIDSEYEAMMKNCYRLDLSLADLENLAKNAEEMSDDEKEEEPKEKPKTPSVSQKNKGNNPEDILASILRDNTPEKDEKKKKNQVTTVSLPAFIGTKDLFGDFSSGPSEPSLKRAGHSLDSSSIMNPKRPKQDSKKSEPSKPETPNQPPKKKLSTFTEVQPPASANTPMNKVSNSRSSSDDDSSSEEDNNQDKVVSKHSAKSNHPLRSTESDEKKTVIASNLKFKQVLEKTNPSRSSSSGSSSDESESEGEDEISRTQPKSSSSSCSKKFDSNLAVFRPTIPDAKKQLQDNQKRLAALQQRKKETEEQKKLIQGALSNMDTTNTSKAKHIVFDSDEESDEATNQQQVEQTASHKSKPFEDDSESDSEDLQTATSKEDLKEKSNQKSAGTKLFESSDDEDEGEEEDDAGKDRFQIKPQFEGKAGKKLMELQSRFGADSRFQMDSRFLESDHEKEDEDGTAPTRDGEEELLKEKQKNLDILNGIVKTSAREPVKAKMFKDVSALHYDPTREEHATFESKIQQTVAKESKAARRKKREEAVKLPEVSKDIYFDVSVDLKNVFGMSKDSKDETETRNKISWDKEDDDPEDKTTQDATQELSSISNAETHEDMSGGFKFSFFGSEADTETTSKTDEYKLETLKVAKFSWQADPRFQDSSSDEEGVDEVKPDQSASSKITEEPAPSKKMFFFFYPDDERLKEGPAMFYRTVKLQEQREAWEERRLTLREEYRKKHRDAKRRKRPSVKTLSL